MNARTCFAVSIFCSVSFVAGRAVALVDCVEGCNEVEAQYWTSAMNTCRVFQNPQAFSLSQVVTDLGGQPAATGGSNNLWACPSCPEACSNNPLVPSREQEKPADLENCVNYGPISRFDCIPNP